MDVPSPIDFSKRESAKAWADRANAKRPWRVAFSRAIAAEFNRLRVPTLSVLELGSGPGFLAECVLNDVPVAQYTLLDTSEPMHELARARLGENDRVRYVCRDFKNDEWWRGLGLFHAVVTIQAVHELRHKRHAVGLHRCVLRSLHPDGLYLVCDHVAGPTGMADTELYMTVAEQFEALETAGFCDVAVVLEAGGLVLLRGVQPHNQPLPQ